MNNPRKDIYILHLNLFSKTENIFKYYHTMKHTKISYEEIYDDRFFHSYFL